MAKMAKEAKEARMAKTAKMAKEARMARMAKAANEESCNGDRWTYATLSRLRDVASGRRCGSRSTIW